AWSQSVATVNQAPAAWVLALPAAVIRCRPGCAERGTVSVSGPAPPALPVVTVASLRPSKLTVSVSPCVKPLPVRVSAVPGAPRRTLTVTAGGRAAAGLAKQPVFALAAWPLGQIVPADQLTFFRRAFVAVSSAPVRSAPFSRAPPRLAPAKSALPRS